MKMKMKMKKKILAISIVLALVCLLCICISSGSGKTKVTIIDNEGNTVQTTSKQLSAMRDENEARFKKLYEDTQITLVGTVRAVDSNINVVNSDLVMDAIVLEGFSIYVYHDSHDDILFELNPGDKVEVTSIYHPTSLYKVYHLAKEYDPSLGRIAIHDKTTIILK